MEFDIGDILKSNLTNKIFVINSYRKFSDTFAICDENGMLIEYSINKNDVRNFIINNKLIKIRNLKDFNYENSSDESGLY